MKEQWMIKNHLAEKIYIVGGGNTYLIKDILKKEGFRYSKLWGWYSCDILPIPAHYKLYCFAFDDLYQWEEKHNKAFPYYEIYEKIKNNLYNKNNDIFYINLVKEKENGNK